MSRGMSDKEIAQARKLRAEGKTLHEVANILGYNYTTISRNTKPGGLAKHRDRQAEYYRRKTERAEVKQRRIADGSVFGSAGNCGEAPHVRERAERLMAQIPHDTRNLTQRMFGDPLPQRSALWQKTHGQGA